MIKGSFDDYLNAIEQLHLCFSNFNYELNENIVNYDEDGIKFKNFLSFLNKNLKDLLDGGTEALRKDFAKEDEAAEVAENEEAICANCFYYSIEAERRYCFRFPGNLYKYSGYTSPFSWCGEFKGKGGD